jgi:glutamine cyclotransferase
MRRTAVVIRPSGSLPHDSEAFTEGLTVAGGRLFESTGLRQRSSLRLIDSRSGTIIESVALSFLFAEGLAAVGDRLVQATWRDRIALIWDVNAMEIVDTLTWYGETWGLASDGGGWLFAGDGSSQLKRISASSFQVADSITVRVAGTPLDSINELEWINGEIWANVLPTDRVVRIDPESGDVLGVLQIVPPHPPLGDDQRPANGIAFDRGTRTVYFTGKRWDVILSVGLKELCEEMGPGGMACR